MNMTDIFNTARTSPLELSEERALIAEAKLGSEDAKLRLARAYSPVMKSTIGTLSIESGALDTDDLRMAALVGLLSAIEAFDPEKHQRLAAIAPQHVRDEVHEAVGTSNGFAVPERTLTRFFSIMRKAEGDVIAAAALAPEYSMTAATFLDVLAAVRGTDSLTGGAHGEEGGDPLADASVINTTEAQALNGVTVVSTERIVEDEMLAEQALAALEGHAVEQDVVGLAYGFTDYNPYSDAAIAGALGMTKPTVQRRRTGALDLMRDALGVA